MYNTVLVGRVKDTLLLVVDGDGVEHDFAYGVAVAILDHADIQLARIVARVGVGGYLISIAPHVKCAVDLDEIGVGIGVKEAIDDGFFLVFCIEVDVGRAGEKKCSEWQAKDDVKSFHGAFVVKSRCNNTNNSVSNKILLL